MKEEFFQLKIKENEWVNFFFFSQTFDSSPLNKFWGHILVPGYENVPDFTDSNNEELYETTGLPWRLSGKEPVYQFRRRQRCEFNLCGKDPLEEGMTTHSSILAWIIPWMEEPGGLQSTGLQRVRHD